MTTGQRLVELSGLPSGSALAHFSAITHTGGGTGQTVFAHRSNVSIVQASWSVLRKANKSVSDDAQRGREIDSRRMAVHVLTGAADSVLVTSMSDEITVVQKQMTTTVEQKLMTETIKRVCNGL